MKCSLIYMDYEGRADGRSIKTILAHVAPLKLVRVFLCACHLSFTSAKAVDMMFLCAIMFLWRGILFFFFFLHVLSV